MPLLAGDPAYKGLEVQLLDSTVEKYKNLDPLNDNGGIYRIQAPLKQNFSPVGEWNHYKITVNANHITVESNGEVINDVNLLKGRPLKFDRAYRRSGHIALCGHAADITFKNITVKELPTKVDDDGFTPLFNGDNIEGWRGLLEVEPQKPGTYRHGVLVSSKGKAMTKKAYGDFEFTFEFALPENGSSGLGILYPGKGDPSKTGLEIQLVDQKAKDSGETTTGSLKHVQPATYSKLKSVGKWNKAKVSSKEGKVVVEINGKVVNEIDLAALRRRKPAKKQLARRSGHIVLSAHSGAARYRKMRIKELSQK